VHGRAETWNNGEVADFRVLTVCTGNVCRSPAAAVLLRQGLVDCGLGDRVEVGSTVLALVRAGYEEPFEHDARCVHQSELVHWDLVLAMTSLHAATIRRKIDQIPEGEPRPDVHLWREFDPKVPANAREEDMEVPDPWYEGQKSFDRTVLGMTRAVPSLVMFVKSRLGRVELPDGLELPAS
jgi:protein-tyrosine phosphatase